MAAITTTYGLLFINGMLYNLGDVIPVVKYVDETGEYWELENVEITGITEECVEFMSQGCIYVVPVYKIQDVE